jgi:hypothetical protein
MKRLIARLLLSGTTSGYGLSHPFPFTRVRRIEAKVFVLVNWAWRRNEPVANVALGNDVAWRCGGFNLGSH